MKKRRKGNLFQRMMAVLLSVVLVTGTVWGAVPMEVFAAETDGTEGDSTLQEVVSENTAGLQGADSENTAGLQGADSENTAGLQESISENTAGLQGADSENIAGLQEVVSENTAGLQGADSENTAGLQGADSENIGEMVEEEAGPAESVVMLTAEQVQSYGLWVEGTQVTDANAADVLGDSTVSYAPETNVLTLNGADLTEEYMDGIYGPAVIYADNTVDPLILNIQGTNTITASGSSSVISGIFAMGPVEFSGDGSLTVTAENQYTYGAGYAVNSLGKVTITEGTYSFTGTGRSSSYGMYVSNGLGTVYVNGGTLTATGVGGNSNVAIYGKLDYNKNPKYEVIASFDASGQSATTLDDPENEELSYYAYIKVMPPIDPVYNENGFFENGKLFYQPAVQADDGYYELKNAGNLFWFAELMKSGTANGRVNVRLTEDITIPDGMNWKPIIVGESDPYRGIFDGNGKSISNLSVPQDDTSARAGLFDTIGDEGVVKNLTMRNVSIKTSGSAGAICGANDGIIENCCNIGGEICVSTTYAGGIVGCNYGKVVRCYNTGTVYAQDAQDENGLDNVGGICGYASEWSEWSECAVIENCYNTGTIGNADVKRAGGITGGYGTGTKITGCYNIGAVTAWYDAEDIGCCENGSQPPAEDIKNNYYLAETESDDGGRTTEQFASGEVAWLLNEGNTDGTQAYYQTCGEGTPAFTGQTVYRIMSYQCPGDSEGKVVYSNADGNVTGGHSFGAWTVTKFPTESEEGSRERSCSICGYNQAESIPKTTPASSSDPVVQTPQTPNNGGIETDKEQGENTPVMELGTPEGDLINAVLTPEEQSLVTAGTNIKIILVIDNIDASVQEADKQAVAAQAVGYTVGQYLDISLYKIIGDNRTAILQTNGKIRIVIGIPDSMRNTDSQNVRSYAVVRVHDGAAEMLADLDNEEATITIETDLFSTYALVYKDVANAGVQNTGNGDGDSEPKTGDVRPVEIYATLAMVSGLSYLSLLFKDGKMGMTEQEKKELTASIIAWGRKGGKLRKRVALAAIFVVLFYYHSIGKRVCVDWKQIYE